MFEGGGVVAAPRSSEGAEIVPTEFGAGAFEGAAFPTGGGNVAAAAD